MSTHGFSQEQRQRMAQQLVLAPQLRQSLKILQVAALDLRATIQGELQANPTLEELPMDGGGLDDSGEERVEQDEQSSQELEFEKNFEILKQLDDEYRDFLHQSGTYSAYTAEDAERRQHFFDSLVSETSLQEHLMRQAELAELNGEHLEAIRYLIGSLDDCGFLTQSLPDVALITRLPLQTVKEAAAALQTFDPPGIGAADMRECLLIQLRLRGREKSLAFRIISEHFDLLVRRRIPDLARKLGVEPDEVQQALEEIAQLDPAPGRRFSEDSNRVVVPDVTVEKVGGEWTITLNSDYIPRLRINPVYKDLIAKGKLSREEREYLRERIRSGRFLISSIEQRQQTIERIVREILVLQRDFFEEGVSKLRPLTMTQVAERVGVHETTVSRAIANKFIRTPHGVFELKYFFTPGFQQDDGAAISNTSVKEMIQNLIDGEDRSAPLSDQQICEILRGRGLNIARRTVAKYREELGILPSNLRREY